MKKIKKLLCSNKGNAEMLAMAILVVYVVLVVTPSIRTTSDTIFQGLKNMDDKMKNQMTNGIRN